MPRKKDCTQGADVSQGRKGQHSWNLITDRHSQIKKYLRTCHPGISHLYDCWHVAKGLKKKLLAAAKTKRCAIIGAWVPSIVAHIYWWAMSSGGNTELILATWDSMINHVINIRMHENSLHPECEHDNLPRRLWMDEGTEAHLKFKSIVRAKVLLNDIGQLSSVGQTYSVEVYHSLLLHFLPKMLAYTMKGMKARSFLAAVHFNENSRRTQATTFDGKLRYKVSYPRTQDGTAVLQPLKTEATYAYVDNLLTEVFKRCTGELSTYKKARADKKEPVPPPSAVSIAPFRRSRS